MGFGLGVFYFFYLLFFGDFDLGEGFIHGLHNFVSHAVMCFCNFLLKLLAHFPVFLRVFVRHLIKLRLNIGCLVSELFYEFKLDDGFVAIALV